MSLFSINPIVCFLSLLSVCARLCPLVVSALASVESSSTPCPFGLPLASPSPRRSPCLSSWPSLFSYRITSFTCTTTHSRRRHLSYSGPIPNTPVPLLRTSISVCQLSILFCVFKYSNPSLQSIAKVCKCKTLFTHSMMRKRMSQARCRMRFCVG